MSSDLREHEVREFLSRMAGEMPTPLELPPRAADRARSRLARTIIVALVAGGLAIAGTVSGIQSILRAQPHRPADDTSSPAITLIHVPIEQTHVAVSDGAVWLAGRGIARIDPTTNQVVATIMSVDGYDIESRREGNAIAVGEGGVWISGGAFDGEVLRVNPDTHEILTVHSGGGYSDPYAVTVGAGAVWVTNDRQAGGTVSLVRIDPTEHGATTVTIPLDHPRAVAVSNGIVWVHEGDAYLVAVDPETNSVVSRVRTDIHGDLVAGFGSLWSMSADGSIVRIEPATGNVYASIDLSSTSADYDPSEVHMAVGEGAVWVALNDSDEGAAERHRTKIVRIDPETGRVVGEFELGRDTAAAGIAVGEGAVWVTDGNGTLYRIDPEAVVLEAGS